MQNAVLFESIVALSRASWLLSEGLSPASDRELSYHREQAFKRLAPRMTDLDMAVDDVTLLTITAMSTIDYILGIHAGAGRHIDAVARIVKIRGGFDLNTSWGKLLDWTVTAYSQLWAFVKARNEHVSSPEHSDEAGIPPLSNELCVYPSLPFSTKICHALAKLSATWNDLALANQLSEQMIYTLASLADITVKGNHSSAGDSSPVTSPVSSPSMASDSSVQSPPVRRRLLRAIADAHRLSTLATTDLEHMLTFGVIGLCLTLHTVHCASYPRPTLPGVPHVPAAMLIQLTSTLKDELDTDFDPHEDQLQRQTRLWSLFAVLGSLDASDVEAQQSLASWIEVFDADMASWETTKATLKRFLWNDALGELWRRVWENAAMDDLTESPASRYSNS